MWLYIEKTKKYVLQVFFKGVNQNEFFVYITDKLGRTGANSSFEEINKLWLQFTASTKLEYKNSNNSKIKKAEKRKNQDSHTTAIHVTSEAKVLSLPPTGELGSAGHMTLQALRELFLVLLCWNH